jgi:hypothetical protein
MSSKQDYSRRLDQPDSSDTDLKRSRSRRANKVLREAETRLNGRTSSIFFIIFPIGMLISLSQHHPASPLILHVHDCDRSKAGNVDLIEPGCSIAYKAVRFGFIIRKNYGPLKYALCYATHCIQTH